MTGGSVIASRRNLSTRPLDYELGGSLVPNLQRISRFASRYPPPGFSSLSGTRLRPRSAFSSGSFDVTDDLEDSFLSSQLFGATSPDWNEATHSPYLGGSVASQIGDPVEPALSSLYLNEEGLANWRGECVEETAMGALVTNYGIMSVRLHDGVRVDLTVDKAIRILNYQSNIILALGSNGASAALIHPSGSVYQYGSRVEITTPDSVGNTKSDKCKHDFCRIKLYLDAD
ncbi:unnamed protein product [Orchesella dallaii]|uniref:Uncharacterized protein n=1 Tax=Orchesella dallaii TaxID=48710 RepID=A0ABP1QQW5_9HEXA